MNQTCTENRRQMVHAWNQGGERAVEILLFLLSKSSIWNTKQNFFKINLYRLNSIRCRMISDSFWGIWTFYCLNIKEVRSSGRYTIQPDSSCPIKKHCCLSYTVYFWLKGCCPSYKVYFWLREHCPLYNFHTNRKLYKCPFYLYFWKVSKSKPKENIKDIRNPQSFKHRRKHAGTFSFE